MSLIRTALEWLRQGQWAVTKVETPAGEHIAYEDPRKCYRPETVKCAYCKLDGHHINVCDKFHADKKANITKYCTQGRHYPYLHGVWRCKWCGSHMDDDVVAALMPNHYKVSWAAEEKKSVLYSRPTISDSSDSTSNSRRNRRGRKQNSESTRR